MSCNEMIKFTPKHVSVFFILLLSTLTKHSIGVHHARGKGGHVDQLNRYFSGNKLAARK